MDTKKGLTAPAHVTLSEVHPDIWHRLIFPDYQRKPSPTRVKAIAKGLREGYLAAPILLYGEKDGQTLSIIDGGHRVMAHRLNHEQFHFSQPILALIYSPESIDQNQAFVLENNKLAMNPTAIIQADNRRFISEYVRGLNRAGRPFSGVESIWDYPIRPLSILKAGLILHSPDPDLHNLAYRPVLRAMNDMEDILNQDQAFFRNVLDPFLSYILELWGPQGRHLFNFGILGFAYFLAKNRPRFYPKGELVIKATRPHVSSKRGDVRLERDRSDFQKLAALKDRWEKPGDQLRINASRDPMLIAREINAWFWLNRKKENRLWQPE